MIIGRVAKTVTATIKSQGYEGHKIFVVQPADAQGKETKGAPIVAVDTVQAGVGDLVLVNREGNGTRQILEITKAPIRALIVGIIDQIDTI